jgi:hypothetical protein
MQMCHGDPAACYLRCRITIAQIQAVPYLSQAPRGITSILSVTAGMRSSSTANQ